MKTFPITLLVILFIGCKQTAKRIIDKYPDGQIMTEYIYADKSDTSNYVCKVYYENGGLKYETSISNNKFVGEKKSFYENGNLERIEKLYQPTLLSAERYDCYIINYRPDGSKESEYQYRNDRINGLAIDYDSTGKKVRTVEYMDGKMNGKVTIYYPNGRVKSFVHYRNDSAYGYKYEFSEAGDTLRANIRYGQSDNGVFYKRWLSNGRLLTGSYGDSNRSFVIWKWYDKQRAFIKSTTDKGVFVDSLTNRFIAPE